MAEVRLYRMRPGVRVITASNKVRRVGWRQHLSRVELLPSKQKPDNGARWRRNPGNVG
jgi:hypothetical protein